MKSGAESSVKRSRRATRFLPPFYSSRPTVSAIQWQVDYGPCARRRYDAIGGRNYFVTNRFTGGESRRMMPFEIRNRRGGYSWRSPRPDDWQVGERE